MACLRKHITDRGMTYYVDFTFEGKRHVVSTKTSDPKIATQILHDIQGKIARGKFDLSDFNREQILLSEFFDKYFEYAKSYKRASTIKNERQYAEAFTKSMGNVEIAALQNIRLLDKWRAETTSKVKPATFNIRRRFLHAAFNIAVRWNYLKANPFKNVIKAQHVETRLFMKDEELRAIFALIEKDLASLRVHRHKMFLVKFRLYLLFLLNTGLRREEAIRLTRNEIDLEKNVIHIVHSKTNHIRSIPLNKIARSVIEQLDERLFNDLNKHHVSRKFGQYVKDAEMKGFKLHSLRHTFATNLVSQGVDIYTVSRLLGHSDIKTTLIYAKANLATLEQAVRKLEKPED